MDIRIVKGDIASQEVDAIVVNLFEGVQQPGGATGAVDRALGGGLTQLIADGDVKGKSGEMVLVYTFGKIPAKRVVVAGLGKSDKFNVDAVRKVSADAARFVRRHNCKRATTIVHGAGIGGLEPRDAAQALAEGAIMGLYRFQRYKSSKKDDENDGELQELLVIEAMNERVPALEAGLNAGRIIAEATNLCRDLANIGGNDMAPVHLAEAAREMSERHGLDFRAFDKAEMEAMGMGALLAVAQGSAQEPRFITMRYNSPEARSDRPPVALIGKGVTFDSGGISIKQADGMENMKSDMSGGAAVIAAMSAIAQLRPPINVVGIVPAAENLPSATAYRPGDIVRASNGKTIEVVNTDAEGRMLLADAICWAKREGLSPLVDVATLTGACSVALGPFYSGIMANDQPLADKVIAAAKRAGELVWQLPLTDEYKELVKSDIADVRQTGTGRAGGAISAAQMLHAFAEDTPWAHLDIAPTYRSDRDRGALVKGPTGVAVRTLIAFTQMLADEE